MSNNPVPSLAKRPGVDPRIWFTRARVTELGFDINNGIFADIVYLPDGDPETALVSTCYAGKNFGSYTPLDVDDIVLVAVPIGDPGEGPVIIARLWTAADTPAPEFASNDDPSSDEPTANPTFRLRDGTTWRFVGRNGAKAMWELTGGSTFEVASDATVELSGAARFRAASEAEAILHAPLMKLGDSATLGIARLTDLTVAGEGSTAMVGAMATYFAAAATAWAELGVALLPMAATAGPAATAAAAVATTVAPAIAAWGKISTASLKGFCE